MQQTELGGHKIIHQQLQKPAAFSNPWGPDPASKEQVQYKVPRHGLVMNPPPANHNLLEATHLIILRKINY